MEKHFFISKQLIKYVCKNCDKQVSNKFFHLQRFSLCYYQLFCFHQEDNWALAGINEKGVLGNPLIQTCL